MQGMALIVLSESNQQLSHSAWKKVSWGQLKMAGWTHWFISSPFSTPPRDSRGGKKTKRCINPQEKKRKGRANESRFFTKFSKMGDEGAKRKSSPEGPPVMKVSVKWVRPMEPLWTGALRGAPLEGGGEGRTTGLLGCPLGQVTAPREKGGSILRKNGATEASNWEIWGTEGWRLRLSVSLPTLCSGHCRHVISS